MPDNTVHYLRSKLGHREYIRVEGTQVTRVINKQSLAVINHQDSAMMVEYYLSDPAYVPDAEAEFKKAHADALAICTTMKIV